MLVHRWALMASTTSNRAAESASRLGLVVRERDVLGDILDDDDDGDDGDEGPSEELGVGEGHRSDHARPAGLCSGGVADERPAWPPRRPDVARTPREGADDRRRAGCGQTACQLGRRRGNQLPQDCEAAAADPRGRRGREDAGRPPLVEIIPDVASGRKFHSCPSVASPSQYP